MGFHKNKILGTQVQIQTMRNLYPQFKASKKSEDEVEFTGQLQVKPELPVYTVSIVYRGQESPIIKVISPKLVENAKHVYRNNGALCLYHPKDFTWNGERLIAKEIVSWTAAWIYFYEAWLQKSVWYGPEAEHK